jgi:hypothetical protein
VVQGAWRRHRDNRRWGQRWPSRHGAGASGVRRMALLFIPGLSVLTFRAAVAGHLSLCSPGRSWKLAGTLVTQAPRLSLSTSLLSLLLALLLAQFRGLCSGAPALPWCRAGRYPSRSAMVLPPTVAGVARS